MINNYILQGYRALTVGERESTEKAILWLKKKHLTIREIAFLSLRNIDLENKTITIKREGKRIVVWRKVNYANSPFDLYLTEVFPCLKSNRFIFVGWAWNGRRTQLCQHIPLERVEQITREKAKSVLTFRLKFDTLKVAKVNLHITN